MATHKKKGRWIRFWLRINGPTRTREMLANTIRKRSSAIGAFSFPLDLPTIKNVLIILPGKRLEVIHQLQNVFELVALFKNAHIYLLCEEPSAPLAAMIGNSEIVSYSLDDKKLFSESFNTFGHTFRGTVDVCCLLQRTEDLPLLYLAGSTLAPIRIGYGGAGGPPFLNLHVNPSSKRVYAPDWNCAMAEMLGAKKIKHITSRVAKSTTEEIGHHLRELHLGEDNLIGIDIAYFTRAFGSDWTDALVTALQPIMPKSASYLYCKVAISSTEQAKYAHYNLPLLAGLSLPQTAEMVTRSKVIITGNTLLFGLAAFLDEQAIGLFSAQKLEAYCPPNSPIHIGIAYEKSPDSTTIDRIVAVMTALTKKEL